MLTCHIPLTSDGGQIIASILFIDHFLYQTGTADWLDATVATALSPA